jgi:hypothetical protein
MSKIYPIKKGMSRCPSYDEFLRADTCTLENEKQIDKYMLLERMCRQILLSEDITADECLQTKINYERFMKKRLELIEEYDILMVYIKVIYNRLCEEFELYKTDHEAFKQKYSQYRNNKQRPR